MSASRESVAAFADAIAKLQVKEAAAHELGFAFSYLFRGDYTEEDASELLRLLSEKGETGEEVARVINAYEFNYDDTQLDKFILPNSIGRSDIMDVCGTGGDGKNSLNISTAVAFVAAGAGVPVVKHGNRGVSSKSGSSDVLSSLGVEIDVPAYIMEEALQKANIAFLFAPRYHPKFKEFAPIRAKLKMRTVFNLLGPLLNPAAPKRQLIGVFGKDKVNIVAEYLRSRDLTKAMVVHSADGFDELSCSAMNYVAEVQGKNMPIQEYMLDPAALPLPTLKGDLEGQDATYNAGRLRQLLAGQDDGLYLSTVLLNAGAAIYIGGKAKDIKEGLAKAELSITSGSASNSLDTLVSITQAGKHA